MSNAHIVFCGLHAIMGHKSFISCGPVFGLALRIFDGSTQMVGTMVLGNTANLPQGFFDPLSQSFKRFAETDAHRLNIGVGEHKMMQHMGKRHTCKGDTQILHMSKIRLSPFPREVLLCKHHFTIWSMQHTPLLNMALERTHLCRLIATRVSLAQQGEQR